MRGRKTDALGPQVQQAPMGQNPVNILGICGAGLNPMRQAKMVENHKAALSSQRECTVRVLNRSQGNLVGLQTDGRAGGYGPVMLPSYPGIWGGNA